MGSTRLVYFLNDAETKELQISCLGRLVSIYGGDIEWPVGPCDLTTPVFFSGLYEGKGLWNNIDRNK